MKLSLLFVGCNYINLSTSGCLNVLVLPVSSGRDRSSICRCYIYVKQINTLNRSLFARWWPHVGIRTGENCSGFNGPLRNYDLGKHCIISVLSLVCASHISSVMCGCETEKTFSFMFTFTSVLGCQKRVDDQLADNRFDQPPLLMG